jgi:hypothetical protein
LRTATPPFTSITYEARLAVLSPPMPVMPPAFRMRPASYITVMPVTASAPSPQAARTRGSSVQAKARRKRRA